MFGILFLQMVATFLVSYLSKNLGPYSPFDIKDFGRITYNRPPPPPQVYFPNSADYAEEFYLRSLSNLTVTPSSLHFNVTDSSDSLPKPGTSFLGISSFPRLIKDIFHGLTKVATWVATTAVELIVAALISLPAMGSPAAVAYALHEQKKRDWQELENSRVSSLLPSIKKVVELVDSQWVYIDALRAQLRQSQEKIESQNTGFARLVSLQEGLEKELKILDELLRSQQETFDQRLEALMQERDARQEEHIALVQAQQTATERITELEDSLDAQQKSGQEATEKLEGELKMARDHIEGLMATIRSNSQELQMYRDRARAQRQAGPSGHYPTHPVGSPFPPAPMGNQFPPGRSLVPRPTQNPGFPPNRASGFMGNTPPPGWGGGAGTGGGRA